MAKTKISEWSTTPASNTDIDGINIAEGCAPSGINDAIRDMMAQIRSWQSGATGDPFNGPVGTTPNTGAFTNLTASGTLGVTGVATLGAGAILNTPASVTLTNATGLPISTGVSGLGTGIATALAVNTGSAGAPVLFNGALGTPSSGTVTNLTGTASININGTVGATTASTGAFTTLSASSTVTLSGGTANGVTYLNGSKVLTSGSALQFDGSKLGVGTTPAATIHGAVADGGYVLGLSGTTKGLRVSTDSSQTLIQGVDNTLIGSYQPLTLGGSILVFQANGTTEGMRLTSTGLGIGTSSPAVKLQVSSGEARVRLSATNASSGSWELISGGGGVTGAGYFSLYDVANSAQKIVIAPSAGEAIRIDGSNNVGIGTSSPAAKLSVDSGATGLMAYFNSTNANGGYATGYSSGTAVWDFGTAKQTLGVGGSSDVGLNTRSGFLAFGTANTERARIDSSGNLLVGTTSTNPTHGFVANNNGGNGFYLQIGHPTGTNSGTAYARFMFNQTEIGSITQSGTTAVLYNLTSDQRLKENIQDAESSSSLIDSLQVRKFDWKTDQTHQRYGFIAQELVTVYPEAVHQPEDTEKMMAVDYSKLVPMLVKEIQSLRARVAQLETN